VFRNVQIRSKLLAIVVMPLLALVVFATVQVVSSVQSRVGADRLNRATQFASSLTALVDALQRERAISHGYVASARRENYGTMIADRVLVDTALQSFQKNLRWLKPNGFSARFRRDVGTVNASLRDLTDFRSRMETQPVTTLQVAGYYGSRIDALLAVIGDIGAQQGSGSLGNNVDALVAAARAKEAASQAQGLLFSALTAGSFGPEEYQRFATLTGEEQAYLAQFRLAATQEQRDFFSETVTGPDIDRTGTMRQAALTARDVPRGIPPKDWFFASSARVGLLHQVELHVATDVATASADARAAAARRATASVVAMVLVVGLVVGSSLLLGRSMARPLVQLERRVREVASTELPGVVERLQRADEGAELTAIAQEAAGGLPIRSTDEIGRLATAFNSVHRVAVRVATEQAALRRSIGDMFVNLARRSQSLIDRQLNLIEELERRTEDPDHLDELFRLDHLATRMRRNAENLLVLASAEPGRRWSEPIPLADVMRAAGSEVEDFTRVELVTGDQVLLAGHATSDVVHLLSELIENATTFSPPDTPVRVAAEPTATGYLVEIEDRGLGMTEDELASANERLANPPDIDFALSRMLGFFVVGRLAERHGIRVQLRHSWYGGVTALVLIPSALLLTEPRLARSTAGGRQRPAAQLTAPVAWPEHDGALPGASLADLGFDGPGPQGPGPQGAQPATESAQPAVDPSAPKGPAGGSPPPAS
jgi:signal transduction histidine kinase